MVLVFLLHSSLYCFFLDNLWNLCYCIKRGFFLPAYKWKQYRKKKKIIKFSFILFFRSFLWSSVRPRRASCLGRCYKSCISRCCRLKTRRTSTGRLGQVWIGLDRLGQVRLCYVTFKFFNVLRKILDRFNKHLWNLESKKSNVISFALSNLYYCY